VYVLKRIDAQNKIQKNLQKIQDLTQQDLNNYEEEEEGQHDEFPALEPEEYLKAIEASPTKSEEPTKSEGQHSTVSFNPLETAPTFKCGEPLTKQNMKELDGHTSFYLDKVAHEVKLKNAADKEVDGLKKELVTLVHDKIELIAN